MRQGGIFAIWQCGALTLAAGLLVAPMFWRRFRKACYVPIPDDEITVLKQETLSSIMEPGVV